jgi:hypothetical protein
VDVTEIGFEPKPRWMGQGNKGFTVPLAMRAEVALDLAVASRVTVFTAKAAKHLLGGVPLLGRGVLVLGQDLVDDRLERPQNGCGAVPGLTSGYGLRLLQDLADLGPRVMESARNLADAHGIAMRSADCSVIVHRKHILDLRGVVFREENHCTRRVLWGGSVLGAHFAPGWVRFRRSFPPALAIRSG